MAMGYEQAVKNYFLTVSGFWLDAVGRWQSARDKASQTPPVYTASDATADVIALWAKAMDAWWGLIPFTGSPLLPTVFRIVQANALPTQTADLGHVTTIQTLSDSPQLKSTPLFIVGAASAPIAPAQVSVTAAGDGFDVKLDFTAVNAAPAAGLYQGIAYKGSDETPLAVIVVNVT